MQRSQVVGNSLENVYEELQIDMLMRSPGIAEWWQANKSRLPADFVALLDARAQESAGS